MNFTGMILPLMALGAGTSLLPGRVRSFTYVGLRARYGCSVCIRVYEEKSDSVHYYILITHSVSMYGPRLLFVAVAPAPMIYM